MKGFQRISVFAACLLVTAAAAGAQAPRLQSARGCSDVSWLDPQKPPRFLTDVNQAAGSGNCQFHEFASQNLLALVLGPSPAIRTWPTAMQVFPAKGPATCVPAPLGSTVGPVLRKVSSPTVGEIDQATGQPLVDQGGRYVQYEIRVNPQLCDVVDRCQLYNQQCVDKASTASPAFRFPAGDAKTPGVAEVKLAWRVMETCDGSLPDSPADCIKDNLADFLTIKNIRVEPYSPKHADAVKVTLGLVGFHLIQKTATHQEYIWATWEHVSNAPVCAGTDNTVCQDPSASPVASQLPRGWSLANPPAPDPTKCNIDNPCANTAYNNDPSGKLQPPTQVCRVYPCGNGDQGDIASLNNAIRAKLGIAKNVWSHYFLVGTLWGQGPFDPKAEPKAAGSVLLANTTMETFIQVDKSPSPQSCFFCHRNQANVDFSLSRANLDFSHSVVRAQQSPGSCPVDINTCASPAPPQPVRSSKR